MINIGCSLLRGYFNYPKLHNHPNATARRRQTRSVAESLTSLCSRLLAIFGLTTTLMRRDWQMLSTITDDHLVDVVVPVKVHSYCSFWIIHHPYFQMTKHFNIYTPILKFPRATQGWAIHHRFWFFCCEFVFSKHFPRFAISPFHKDWSIPCYQSNQEI